MLLWMQGTYLVFPVIEYFYVIGHFYLPSQTVSLHAG